jgi:DNA-binding winged helix-turn-helix (wHTH) protein/tetratricopeptide (TPR) repeat protein
LTYLFHEYELDDLDFCLTRNGKRVPLEPKSLRVLLLLVTSDGKLIEKSVLLQSVWKDTFVEETTLTRAIALLRKQLGDDPRSPKFIETVPTLGYRFIAPVKVQSAIKQQEASESAEDDPNHAASVIAALPGSILAIQPSTAVTEAKPQEPRRRFLWFSALGVATTVLLLAVIVGSFRWVRRSTPVLTDKDTILLDDFRNSTGDPVFDDTLRQGLTVQLEQSPLLNLVSEEQIQRTLSLMGQSPGAALTVELNRELCQRVGAAAILDGSIARLGEQYVLGLRATHCQTGALIDAEQIQVARKEELLDALGQIASKFRTRIGESLASVKNRDTPLVEATTPSLEALKAYSAGVKTLSANGSFAALPFFRRATELDPQFSTAHAWLGRMYADLGEDALSVQSTRQAFQLRARASERERFFIDSSYDILVTGDLAKAQEVCESWVQAYPRDSSPHGFLSGLVYPPFGRYEDASREAKKMIELAPDLFVGYMNLVSSYLALGRLEDADLVLHKVSNLKMEGLYFAFDRYSLAFLRGDESGMKEAASAAEKMQGAAQWMIDMRASTLAYSGQLHKAREELQRADIFVRQTQAGEFAAHHEAVSAMLEAYLGNTESARRHAVTSLKLSRSKDNEYLAAYALGLVKDIPHVQEVAEDLEKRFPMDTNVQLRQVPTLRALLALNQKNPEKAIEILQIATPVELGSIPAPVYVRGEAFLALGRGREAAAEFQKILDHRGIVTNDPSGAIARLQMGRAYVLSGEKTKAKTAYEDFLNLWKNADSDLPLLSQARREFAPQI